MYGPRNSILDTIGHTPVARINKARRPATRIVLCEPDNAPSAVLCMIPDTGERYLSTPQFEGISETMTEEEEIASTEGYRIAAPSAQPGPVTATSAERPAPKPQATQLVDQTIRDNPVVMFALEWCELCWALRKFFRVHGIAYRSVDLDSVELQHDDLGGEIRQDLHRRLGSPTIPQVFVGGAAIGGCTETLELFRTGELQARLTLSGVAFDASVEGGPARFLPRWVHPR
jgi:cysteine synthase A